MDRIAGRTLPSLDGSYSVQQDHTRIMQRWTPSCSRLFPIRSDFMHRKFVNACSLVVVIAAFTGIGQTQIRAAELVVSSGPREAAEEGKSFHLPPGFEAQLVASEPDIHKPINIAFDDNDASSNRTYSASTLVQITLWAGEQIWQNGVGCNGKRWNRRQCSR